MAVPLVFPDRSALLKYIFNLLVPLWRHQKETSSASLALCVGNSPGAGEFPSQKPVTQSFDVSLICAWINGWVNNRKAGDLRRHRAHYDVTEMARRFYWVGYGTLQIVRR